MFATVECQDATGGFRTFVRDLFFLPEIEIRRISLFSGEAFYRVIAKEYRGQIPVEEICEKLVRLKKSVIFEVNFPCDEKTEEFEFYSDELKKQLLFNSAREYVTSLALPPMKSSVSIFDPTGVYADKIDSIVGLFSGIEVYTGCKENYADRERLLMEKYGLSLIVRDSFSGRPPDSTVIICPDDVPFSGFFKGIIFTNAEDNPPCGCCVRGDGIDLPAEYAMLRPQGISEMAFASALFEKCRVKELGELSFRKLRLT